MITINYLEDKNGEQQVAAEIIDIAIKGQSDPGHAELAKYIAEALEFLKNVGIPSRKALLPFTTTNADGNPLTFASILKELKGHPPLMEFRVNWRDTGYFRAIFFYLDDGQGNQNIFFTKAILKQERNPPAFNLLIIESEQMMKHFLKTNEME